MKIKNVKSPKQPGWRYIKKIQKYENKGRENSVVIASNTLYFIVDERYEKKCRKLLKKYENNLQRKRIGVLVFLTTGTLATAAVAWLLTHQKPNLQTSSLSFLEEQDDTVDNIEDNNCSYNDKEIVKCEIIDEVLEARKEQEEIYLIKSLNRKMYDTYIKKYCGYFHFDSDKVVKLARNMTNNYEDFSSIITEEDCNVTNKEAVSMQFVYLLYRNELPINWEEMGFTNEDVVLTNEITTLSYNNLSEPYLQEGLTYSEFLEKTCDMIKINDKQLALSVSFSEIGKTGSPLSKEQNNYGGMKARNGKWASFPTSEAGIICFCENFKRHYNDYTLETAGDMALVYVGRKSSATERAIWVINVTSFYNEIQDNYDFYFSDDQGPDPDPDVENEIQETTPRLIRTKEKAV